MIWSAWQALCWPYFDILTAIDSKALERYRHGRGKDVCSSFDQHTKSSDSSVGLHLARQHSRIAP